MLGGVSLLANMKFPNNDNDDDNTNDNQQFSMNNKKMADYDAIMASDPLIDDVVADVLGYGVGVPPKPEPPKKGKFKGGGKTGRPANNNAVRFGVK